MKKCFKCEETKPYTEFYKHKAMADGYIGKCKECNKADVRSNRKLKLEYYREYDRERGNRQDAEYVRNWRKANPKKYSSHLLVSSGLKSGKLVKEDKCRVCGEPSQVAHHDDYDKPLEVRWLCQACHVAWHKINGEALNAH